ncbi:MAG: arylsulfatase [Deltaproteobacteria bacterium]|nr:arylsulfatase [Deltaproteobacteria bacterium]
MRVSSKIHGFISRRLGSVALFGLLCAACASSPNQGAHGEMPSAKRPPNIIFIMADDLGYGELGAYGQRTIKTPRLDRMAAEGLKFSDFYAGTTVCAPSRAVLMTGRHTGRVSIRGNANKEIQKLSRSETTLAEVLKPAGYNTALVGKWGMGEEGSGARPNERGFDFFYGYLNQVHAHNYYPEFVWRNDRKEPLRNVVQPAKEGYGDFQGGYATQKIDYTHDLFMNEATAWVRGQNKQPFFLYLALTTPHANNEAAKELGDGQEVPDYGIYADRPWPNAQKGQAAMVSRLDKDVGRLLDLLVELHIDKDTLVLFTSDNGPHAEGGFDVASFTPAGPLRGIKRDLYEGGIREPLIAWWPGTIAAGRISRHVGYLGDVMATVADLARVPVPANINSLSFAPELRGQRQPPHEHLYFEFYEQGGKQAVRKGPWKAVRAGLGQGPLELYDLEKDLGESQDVAALHPDIVEQMITIMAEEHVEDPRWKVGGHAPPPPPPGHGRAPF